MAENKNLKSTKELILDTAFSFLEEPGYSSFSMNELAAKVGVTKPAIYRHFNGKDALLDAMEDRVIDNLSFYLKDIGNENLELVEKSLKNLIEYFIENPTHINYLIAQMSSNQNYEEKMLSKLYERKIPFVMEKMRVSGNSDYLYNFKNDIEIFVRHVFSGMTIFFFVKVQERLRLDGGLNATPENFAEKIVRLMLSGIRGTTKDSDALYPEEISKERQEELTKFCKIDAKTFPEENRIFTALAKTIEKYKIPGVTVERIANELGMAKSSLYEYFDNKNQMIRTLIGKELNLLQTIVNENSVEAKNFTEYIVIVLSSELEYFMKRPSIIPICGWLLMTRENFSKEKSENCENEFEFSPWESRFPDRVTAPDLGFPYKPDVLTGWIKCLPISFLVEAKGKNLTEEKRMEGFMLMINYILNGIGGK